MQRSATQVLHRCFSRTFASVSVAVLALAISVASAYAQDPVSTVSAVSPSAVVTTVNPTVSVPVTLSRGVTTPILGFSVTFTLSAGLTTSIGAISQGGFLAASGATTSFQVTDNGGGNYTADGVTLGLPCGSSATSGTLFTIGVGSTLTNGSGTVTINSVTVRDCSNAPLATAIGTAATSTVDRSVPSVSVTSPNGGEIWLAGSVQAITWTASDAEGIATNGITLEYSVNDGASWLPVASALANSGTFGWTVPSNPSTTARVRATAVDVNGNPANDASDAAFTIQGTTSTSLASTPNPSVTGESVTLTATVEPAISGGTVEFFDGPVSLGIAAVLNGNTVIGSVNLAPGPHSLTAVFSGTALYAGSTSAEHAHTVNPATTTTAVTSSPNPSVFGEGVALNVTVAPVAPGAGVPTGSVELFDGATSLGLSTLSSGSASLNTSSLAAGAHSITAVYAGDAGFSGSTSAAHSHTVNPAATTTSLANAPNPSVSGESVTLTATVAAVAPGAGGPGGSVEFFDGATSLGLGSLSGGSASLATSALAVGTHSLTAVYAGSASFTGSTSAASSQVVNQASTTTSVTSSPNPSVFGEGVAIGVTVAPVAPGTGVPGGSVELFDGATSLGLASLSGGTAVLNTSSLATGAHSLSAVYAGDVNFTGSTSAAHGHTVNPASTTTSLASAPNPSSFGSSVTLTATVAVVAPGAGGPGGSVTFFDGATSLGSAPLSGGSASVATSSLATGTHSLTAVYAGATDFNGSTSAVQSHVVNAAATTTALTSSPNPSVAGELVALTASVSPNTATGSVEFFDGAVSLGTASLSGGSATVNTASLAVGAHSLTAVYAGDASFTGSTSAAHSHAVNAASTTTTLSAAPNPSVFGESVALGVSVAVNPPGSGTATGSVEIFDGATSLGTVTLSGGSATLDVASLAVGSHPLTAVYAGDASRSGSTSSAVSQVVNPASTSTSLASAPNPSQFGQSVTLTATVSVVAPGAGGPGGSVEFFDGATSLGTASLSLGTASLATAAFAVGSHALTAVYAGTPDFTGSTSAIQTQVVNTAGTTTSLASAPNPSSFTQSVTLTATVAVVAPGAGSPGGSVTFFDGATSLGSAPVSSGAASIATSSLATGGHSLTAVYSGDASFGGSTSPVHSHTVDPAASTTTLASSPNPSTFGGSVTITATVAGAGSPGGSVTFFDGATSLGPGTLSGGTASLSTSALTAGTHSLTAVYGGDADHTGSTSNTVSQVVNAAGTTVTLAAAPSPGVFLDPETLTATVSPAAATGSVEFFDGATSLGSSPVSSGTAVLGTSSLAVGTHSLTAVYSGDSNHSGATSSAVSLEIQARIVATAGPNGTLAPLGTVLVSLGATPSFTFSANPGFHVATVTVDGAPAPLGSPYTFAPVSSNHTIDVQFAVNPAVAAITTLAATQVRTGNDSDGNTKITLTWSPVPPGSTVEVWRRGYGNYPEYDDGATPGSVPAAPGAYPPAGWTLTAVANPGDTDEPGVRDFWYYVAYVRDGFGTVSPVSNRTSGTLDYHLGDVSNGFTPGAGDNLVTTADLSVLGANYGFTGPAVAAVRYLDVGPTSDLSVNARPMTDARIDFEDLVMFAINWSPSTSAPQARSRPAAAQADAVALAVPAPGATGSDLAVRVDFTGTGRVLALSVALTWDPAVVQPVAAYTAGDLVLSQGGMVFSAAPGSVDAASFASTGQGLVGEGEFATLHFRVIAAGDPRIGFSRVVARDSQNRSVPVASGVVAAPPRTFVTAFSPAMPNPFRGSTAFQFSLAKAGPVQLEVFSVDGRRVRTLSSGPREPGEYRLEWNGTDDSGRPLAAGVYYARMITAQGRFTRVVSVLR